MCKISQVRLNIYVKVVFVDFNECLISQFVWGYPPDAKNASMFPGVWQLFVTNFLSLVGRPDRFSMHTFAKGPDTFPRGPGSTTSSASVLL